MISQWLPRSFLPPHPPPPQPHPVPQFNYLSRDLPGEEEKAAEKDQFVTPVPNLHHLGPPNTIILKGSTAKEINNRWKRVRQTQTQFFELKVLHQLSTTHVYARNTV
jgi:hypothetical protein